MKIYIRKIYPHDITHEVSVTREVVDDFFDSANSMEFIGKKSNSRVNISINDATDPRFGGGFKSLIISEGKVEADDLFIVYKKTSNYVLEVIKKDDDRYQTLFNFFFGKERHIISTVEEVELNYEDYTIEELSVHLKDMYNELSPKPLGIHLFGIKYGRIINLKNFSLVKLIKKAGLQDSYEKELRKGVILSSYTKIIDKIIPSYWLCSANSSIYNHDASFMQNGEIDWSQDKQFKKAKIGDIVFIYSCSPDKRVKYKCIVVKKDINKKDAIDDSEYWINKERYEGYDGLFIKFKVLKKSDDDRLKYDNLLAKGLKGAPQGAFKLDEKYLSLAHYIDSIFKGYDIEEDNKNINFVSNFEIPRKAKNLVIFGTPGCGKSYYVNNTLLKDYPNKNDNTKERVFRTTFYQDYTNTDFVGQILPHIEYNSEGKETVTYKFNPGPFALALKEAVLNSDKDVALVIEELNRGNAPAIFGDIFQLLDRNENGISQYAITNINLRDYLNREINGANFDKIKIPGNLNIYSTMNTSDQNVFTLDTAFKRRWEFIKLKNQFEDYTDGLGYSHHHEYKSYKVPGLNEITWKTFVEVINSTIIGDLGERNSSINVSDKQIGVYFVDKNGLHEEAIDVSSLSKDEKVEKFAYKVFSYLWDDVAKFDKDQLFVSGIITLDQLIENYITHEIVFKDSINKQFKKEKSDSSENK